jgi:5-formyltetrahydrofolate cyclo-ligase
MNEAIETQPTHASETVEAPVRGHALDTDATQTDVTQAGGASFALENTPENPQDNAQNDAQKKALRVAYRAARKAIAPDVRKKANKAILSKLSGSQVVAKAKTVLIYAATPSEPMLDDLISTLSRAGKRVAVPRITKTPGVMTLWTVRHVDALVEIDNSPIRNVDVTRASPIEPKDIDVVLVPGVAFTRTLGRLGQGGGYYDRMFPRLKPEVKRIGVAYDIQLADALPMEEHDVPMHAVVTEAGVFGDAELLAPIPAAQIGLKPGETAPQVLTESSGTATPPNESAP